MPEAGRRTRETLLLAPLLALLHGDARPPEFPAPRRADPRPHHVRVVWTEAPHERALIAWSTLAPGGEQCVRLDVLPRGGRAEAYAHRLPARSGTFTGKIPLQWHRVELTALQPSTTYWFVVESDGRASREHHFVTAPAGDVDVTILQGGDSRSDRDSRRRMNGRMRSLLEADPAILALAHGGDYVYDGTDLALWIEWLDDHELTVTDRGRVLPVIPARGNHEALGVQFDEVFGAPGGGLGRNWFTTDLGRRARLITLNSEAAAGGAQSEFLRAALAEAGTRFQVVQYHRPIFPAVKVPSEAKPLWQPLFESLGADLVCECDGHVFKRTVPVLGDARDDAAGIVYIGEGGLGVKQRTPETGRWYLEPPGKAASAFHVWKLRFQSARIELAAIDDGGNVIDALSLPSRAAVVSAR